MIYRPLLKAAVIASVIACSGMAAAQEVKAGDLVIEHPWARATPGGAKVGGAYLTITNKGTVADKMLGGSSPAAKRVEVHEMAMKNDVMTMRPLANGLSIGPGQTVTLAPGGYHIMLMDLNRPLKQGQQVPITLRFEKAGTVDVTFDVQGIGAQAPMMMNHGMSGMHDHMK